MIDFTRAEIAEFYRQRVPDLKPQRNGDLRAPCPVHIGKDLNFSVDAATGLCQCWSQCSKGWDMIGLEMELSGLDFVKAKAKVFSIVGRPLPHYDERDIESTFNYTDESGKVLYQVVRKTGKRFMQRRPDPARPGHWIWGLESAMPVPFNLAKLAISPKDTVVAITEGEKDAINLTQAGWLATCNNGGAEHFRPELAKWFDQRHVAIFPDNDDPGRKHAESVAKLLSGVAASVKIVEIPDLPVKGDITDYLRSGKTADDLYELYANAQEWTPEWKFSSAIPHENDKFLRTFDQFVRESGGHEGFWKTIEIEGLPTPFDSLTRNLGGLHPGEVYVIAANQGQGKTSLALQFAITTLERRHGVLIFSMEMSHRDVFQRIAAIDARVDLQLFRRLRKYGEDAILLAQYEEALLASTGKFRRSPLFVSTKNAVTPEFLTEEAARVKGIAKIDLVIVDHMQLMGTAGKPKSDYEKFTGISRATKGIAAELGVPLLLVSQTSRANANDKRSELDVSDIRGSGAIEEDAAAVMLLYYDGEDFRQAKIENADRLKRGPIKSWLKLGKNRYGPQGTYLPLNHFVAQTRFDLIDGGH
jgi:replicative DNA helicase